MRVLKDSFQRVHDYLRISLTDKCNLNCIYCNPVNYKYEKLQHKEILSYDELLRLINIFAGKLGVRKIRFTGGESLARRDVMIFFESVHELKSKYGFDFALTTNGTLLEDKLYGLKQFGLDFLNISLDSLNPEKYKQITGKDNLNSVLRAIIKASELEFHPLKINVVVIKGVNDDEIIDFVEFVKDTKMNVRFIEFMPFGNNQWTNEGFIGCNEIKRVIQRKYGLTDITTNKNKVAKDCSLVGFTGTVSLISSISNHFCEKCNRLRIDARGNLKLCLFSSGRNELNFKQLFRETNYTDEDISELIEEALQLKPKAHPGIDELLKLEKNNMLSIGG